MLVQKRAQLSCLRQARRLGENPAMVRTSFTGEQRQQGKHARVGSPSERERGQRVSAPPKATHDVAAVPLDRTKGRIQGRTVRCH